MDHTADHKAWESASDEILLPDLQIKCCDTWLDYPSPGGVTHCPQCGSTFTTPPFVPIMATVETDIDSLRKIDPQLTYEQAAKHVFYGLAWSIADDVNNGTEIHPDRLARYRYIRQIVQGY